MFNVALSMTRADALHAISVVNATVTRSGCSGDIRIGQNPPQIMVA